MVWHNKHQVSDQIEEKSFFWKKQIFRFAKSDSSVFSRCAVQQSVLLDQVQQNWTVRFLKQDGPEFPGVRTNKAKQ
jgi:hypothetical protein